MYSKELSIQDFEALEIFYNKVYPNKKDIKEYLNRTIFSLPASKLKESLIIYEDDIIIGVNLCLPATVLIGKGEYDMIWSYDTYVLPEYRSSDAGTLIGAFWYKRKDIFGAGLSEISVKMCKVMKSKFIGYASAFVKFNFRSHYLINIIKPIFSIKKLLCKELPQSIRIKDIEFIKIDSPNQMKYPETGYWNNNIIEFKRDISFITWRFFYLNSPYSVYIKKGTPDQDIYFVVRITQWHNIPLLYVVDYRINLDNITDFHHILDCAYRLSKQLSCAGVYIRCSLNQLKDICGSKHFIKKGQGAQLVTRFSPAVRTDYPVLFTAADSDMDFK